MHTEGFKIDDEVDKNLKEQIFRYLSFWPFFLILLASLLIFSFLYLRYASYTYESKSIIQILDESQESEMALPTELTIFNRSMINLENK